MQKNIESIKTFGELKASDYRTRSVKDELRSNLIYKLKKGDNPFDGIVGYDETVIPDIQTAILSRHNMILLGLRGQAKTKIARLIVNLVDDYLPIVAGSEMHDDPFNPLSRYAKDILSEMGDDTPIEWINRDTRYTEKLATPDVTIADLIGDVDPIKAATLKLPYSDERVIHFGLIPRSHRGIFVINELPDLQARIQVALFNILQEKDVQIRGFKIRLPLDVHFVFTANPEDYTNRGAIVTPLKDRIESQILTHYPRSISDSKKITSSESSLTIDQKENIIVPDIFKNLIEQIAMEARSSEYVDSKSGVSARLTISAYENLVSTAERRMLLNGENLTTIRFSDLGGVIPSITGKIELVYEGEQEGPLKVAHILIGKAVRNQFANYFTSPDLMKKKNQENPYSKIISWFNSGKYIDLNKNASNTDYKDTLHKVNGLSDLVNTFHQNETEENKLLLMEFLLFGLSEYSLLSKEVIESGLKFKDMLSSMFNINQSEDDEDSEENYY